MNNGTYFGQSHTIINAPGLFLSKPEPESETIGTRALVAYPGAVTLQGAHYSELVDAQREAQFVKESLHAIYLHHRQVTVPNLLTRLHRVSIFHFAGHAFSREFGGQLVLQGPTGGDSLSASDLADLKFAKLALVVLSACNTSKAEADSARDPRGLVRAFFRAGARRVIASHWDVDSKTTLDIMKTFYSRLQRQPMTPAVMIECWKQTASQVTSAHPYYWAAFELFANAN